MVYLKELSAQLKGKIKQQNYINANIGVSTRRLLIKNYRQFNVKIDEYPNSYEIGVKVYSTLHFSINRPDYIFSCIQPNKLKDFPNIIYTREEGHVSLRNKTFQKFWDLFSELLNYLQLTVSEGVFFYTNEVIFAFDSKRDLAKALDKIIDLLIENNTIFKKEEKQKIESKNIPDNLKVLLPLLKKYSVSDDSERDELVEQMSNNEKTTLKNIVDPLMAEIEAYLDSFVNKIFPHEASLISDLAELVAELYIN
jgi:hypothetical protein